MSVPSVRRIVVGVDGTAESAAAVRWACREAGLRGAEVHVVHAWEAPCHSMASYAAAQARPPEDGDFDVLWRQVLPDEVPDVRIRTEVAPGLPARVLLERCDGADMLVLGTVCDQEGPGHPAGPVLRACLRRSPCPVVVIGAPPGHDTLPYQDDQRMPAGAARHLGFLPMPAGLPV